MNSQAKRFFIRLALTGMSEVDALALARDIQEELDQRPNLETPRVYWEPIELHIIVEFREEGFDFGRQKAWALEQMSDVLSAVVKSPWEINVELLDIRSDA